MAKSILQKTDEYGFERPDDFNYLMYDEFFSQYLKILATRARKWDDIFASRSLKRGNTLKRYTRKGIPSSQRGFVWMMVSGAELIRVQSPDLYIKLLAVSFEKEIIDIVKTDLPRTFPDNIFFNQTVNRQAQLFNILVAYAHCNRDVGYCQGLNYIAGLLLLVTNSEETSFWLLKALVEQILPPYYTRTMDGLIIDIEVLAELVRQKMPDVHKHVGDMGLPWPVVCTKWFVCLFAEVLPTETVLRVWDSLFYEGSKILFRVGLALIKLHRTEILGCTDFTDLADCFRIMTRGSTVTRCHDFMQSIFKVPGSLSSATIDKLRARFTRERLEQAANR